ncbi:glycerol-3-phosphate phosphatase-like isoform X1 [Acanthaster planci]|uniref:Glycerol-3-phosphate phosphatase-like isoform X1 n=1 Tax=Acanthaster planci TaxID=133434 RepID=A0A8B7XV35_ACAPL|nr:glycerol-3-phosphate phosphatase-like isoform X1 [Acanthaster planci]
MAACRELREEHAKKFLDSIDTVLFDCDGVIWDATDEIPGAKETLRKLKELGKRIIFITNNSTKSRSQYAKKFTQLGFESVPKDHIFCTSFATAHYLKEKLKFEGKVYLIGEEGLKEELTEYGISFTGPGPDPVVGPQKDWLHIPLDPEVKAVCVGFDRTFSYFKILKAASYLNNPNLPFLATNCDKRFPPHLGYDIVLPGTGCIINAVKTAALREPIVLGKPNTYLFECIQQSIKEVDQSRTVMIGDNLNTDIPFGHNCSLKTLFVLTGISTLEEARHFQASNSLEDQKKVPDFYLPSIKELGELIDKVQ